ncbi:MAG: type II secretion system F family protein [Magnetospirillum sp. WYHS-4]
MGPSLDDFIIKVIVGSVIGMVMIGLGIVLTTYVVRPRILLRRRLAAIGVLGDGREGSEKAETRRQKRIQEKIKQLEQKGGKKGFVDQVRLSLLQAGLEVPASAYFIACGIGAVFLPIFYFLTGLPVEGAALAALIGGFGLPRWVLGYLAHQRQKRFTQQFADAIDVVVRGIRSGLPVSECFNVIAREFQDPVSTEFRMIIEGQKLGLTLEDLMRRGLERIPTSEYNFFAIVLQIQKQTGGNLAETLSNLSAVIRERKKLRDKVQALSSEAKSSAMIIGSLPFLVGGILALVNWSYLSVLFNDPIGHILIGGGLAWMAIGVLVMAKMINFEV